MKTTRSYTMTTRAQSAERTRLRILDAAVELAETRLLAEISLEAVAGAADVSVQTVLRRFGNRAGLIEAAHAHATAATTAERETPVGDVSAAVAVVVDHYERRGDGVSLLLAQEHSDPAVRAIVTQGRLLHRDWVSTVFAPYLTGAAAAQQARTDLLAVATDIYTWKQLRRDQGLDRATTEQRICQLVTAILKEG